MTLQQLEYIIALDTHRHYVRAAQHCFISQPNLTMQIKKLEEEIGVRIFDRHKKPLQPTAIGQEIILRARTILREARQLKDFVSQEKDTIQGEYTIGIIPTLAPYLLPLFLPSFLSGNPGVYFNIRELQTGQIISDLENGTIDIGILVTPLNEPALKELPLFYEPFLLYLPENHRFLKKKLMLAKDLEPREILVLEEGHCFRDQALSICKYTDHGSSLGFDYQSGSIEALKSLVKQKVGYTLVPELSVIDELNSPYIKRFGDPQPVREVSIVVHNSYIKESLVSELKTVIQSVIPERFLEKKNPVPMGS